MRDASFADRVHGVATLDHPVTRAAYRLLAERGEVSRDTAAEALDVARSVAAFHLDKLADAGLADVRFERLTGRSGPGAGRTAKLYRRSATEIGVSLPERRYDLAGELLAEAVERSSADGVPVDRALRRSATEAGRRIGTAADGAADPAADRAARQDAVVALLERYGYEPRWRGDQIVLTNCPFHALAEQHRELVCGMNLDLLRGVIDGAGGDDLLETRLAPQQGYCCVRMATS
ncbi:MAG TPA: helix-turn-helix domain-containing protein [Acidimicrobiales bacterium]|nr:helix-turn-helix domain-containing protein [Acidimicrobiales bacterium]